MTTNLFNSLLLFTMVFLNVSANLLVKKGVGESSAEATLLGQLNCYTVSGLMTFGLSFLVYAIILKRMPLNIAQCFIAFQFVAIILAAHFFLHETIPGIRWFGIVMITSGILLIAKTS